jgi:hypothetical protein
MRTGLSGSAHVAEANRHPASVVARFDHRSALSVSEMSIRVERCAGIHVATPAIPTITPETAA